MTFKLVDVNNEEWELFGTLCVVRNRTIKKEIANFVKEYNEKYRGLIK